jgi:ribosomal 50S subunit-recycling heat shock protein
MSENVPPQPPNSTRIKLELGKSESRLDNVLLAAIRAQDDNAQLKIISRVDFKELFNSGKVTIKGQRARPSSGLAAGTTYVDILE